MKTILEGGVIIGHDTNFGNAANYSDYDRKEDKLGEVKDTETTGLECTLEQKDVPDTLEIRVKALEMILDNSGIIAFLRRENGKVEFVSAAVEEFGYKARDFTSGKVNYNELVHPDDLDRVILELKENALEGAAGLSQKYRIRTKKEYIRSIEEKTEFIRDENGNVAYIAGILTDITDN